MKNAVVKQNEVKAVVSKKVSKKISKAITLALVIFGLSSQAWAQKNDLLLKCVTTVYQDFMIEGTDRGLENNFDMKLCNEDSGSECGSKTEAIRGLHSKYQFNAYLTNDPGKSAELNISVLEYNAQGFPVSIVSRDLKDSGFLALKINNDYLIIGCGVRK